MSDIPRIVKYPRTSHLEGSGLQRGDEVLPVASFTEVHGRHLVVEEKMDGANSAVSFGPGRALLLQSRGHYLRGGERERQFELLKPWAQRYAAELWAVLQERYILYGEWLYAKHTVFYTDLPHYFLEFDIYDRQEREFLSTERRLELLAAAPFVASVKVLHAGTLPSLAALVALVGPSHFIALDHMRRLDEIALRRGLDPEQVARETDRSGLMEGLYVKVEEQGVVKERYKYVRPGFLQAVFESDSHWMDRPIVPNQLAAGVSLY